MRSSTRWFLVVFAIPALLSACAATPTTYENEGAETPLSKYSSVEVEVTAPPSIKQLTGYTLTSNALQTEFIENVRDSGRFKSVGTGTAGDQSLQATLLITRFNYVHGASRFLGGVFGGAAVLAVTMTVRDKSSGEILQTVSLHDGSKQLQGIFGATTGRQVSAMAVELAKALK